MPTNNGPMPPPSPYTGGYTNPASVKETITASQKFLKRSRIPRTPFVYILKKIISGIIKFTLLPPIFIFIFTFLAWVFIHSAKELNLNEINLSIPIHTIVSKPYFLILLLIPSLVNIHWFIPDPESTKETPKTPIELKCTEQSAEKSEKTLISKNLDTIKALFPISIVIAFILVLYHNRGISQGNLGLALQITSSQFSEQKSTWAALTIICLILLCISFLPAIVLPFINQPRVNQKIHQYILLKSLKSTQIKQKTYYNYLIIQASCLTTASIIVILPVLKIATDDATIEILLLFMASASMFLCTIPISNVVHGSIIKISQPNKNTKPKRVITIPVATLCTCIVLIACCVLPKIFFEHASQNIGGILANPGATLNSKESDYACIFPNNTKTKESITLGVVVESKPESIRIFTPEYNRNINNYGNKVGGKLELNTLVETQIKIPGGYRIEKFDNKKHRYDLTSGKCVYINPSPFDIFTHSWNTPDRN